MRITNKIMQSNSLININNNKEMQDKLSTQMATGNKRTRPSDDPIGAIRSLRLSTNISKLTQYNEKNAEDADKWLSVTEDAIDSVTEVISDMYNQCQRGSDDSMNTSNYLSLIEQLKSLATEVYACGNADYAGRNLFTGFRTGSSLTFKEDMNIRYSINQNFTLQDMQQRTNIDTGDIMNYTEANGFTTEEAEVTSNEYNRIRLAYDNLDLNGTTPAFTYTDADGNDQALTLTVKNSTDAGAYQPAAGENYILADTGEIVFGEDAYAALSALPTGTEFTVTYEKSEWTKGELKPEHYFDCVTTDLLTGETIQYASGSEQEIYYDLGANQTLKVNTNADEVFSHDILRDVEDLEVMVNQLKSLDDIVEKLEKKADSGLDGADLAAVEEQLLAAKKAQSLKKDQVQKAFGAAMTSMQGYQDQAGIAMTNVGTKGSRLELIQNRLTSQQDSFEELLYSNDKKEIEETTTELSSAKLAYDAALSATASILQNSLMNYI